VGTPKLQIPGKLSDGVVSLRRWSRNDVPAIVEALRDPEIPRWTMIPTPYGPDDARAFLRGLEQRTTLGTELGFAVVPAARDTLLGSIGLAEIDHVNLTGEIGYWIAKGARGHGHAVRAVRVLSRWALEDLRLERLEIHTHVDNPSSQRVAEKAGFTREGVMRSYRDQRGTRVDLVMWSLLPGDLRRTREHST
jgi:RimJ/RimL family protein N-acetyltransferase